MVQKYFALRHRHCSGTVAVYRVIVLNSHTRIAYCTVEAINVFEKKLRLVIKTKKTNVR